MINSDLLDFSNSNLLDSTIVGKSTVNLRRRGRGHGKRRRFSNAEGGVDYGALATATAGLAATIANRPRNEAKDAAKMQKKQGRQAKRTEKRDMKTVCGRKPLLKKKRGTWDKCVADYMKNKQPTSTPVDSSESYKAAQNTYSSPSDNYSEQSDYKNKSDGKKILGMPQKVAIPVIIGVVAIAGFFVYKKFFAKGAVATAAAPAVGA